MSTRAGRSLALPMRVALVFVGACAANAGAIDDAGLDARPTADGNPLVDAALDGAGLDATPTADGNTSVDAALDGPLDPPCLPGDPHPWWCVPPGSTGPICGDVRLNPSCVDGEWECGTFGGLVPDREHACECFTGPRPMTQSCVCTDGVLECTFPCGPSLRCQLETEYCAVTASDVGGEPDSYVCASFLDPCDGFGCACVAAGSISCESDVGAVTARYPGG